MGSPLIKIERRLKPMPTKLAKVIFLLSLVPSAVLATPKNKETVQIKVVSSRTEIHGSSPGDVFTYTSLIFAEVRGAEVKGVEANGVKVVYACDQRGDICPLLESGKTYTAEREGQFLYLSSTSPTSQKALVAKYKQAGGW
jgi:hypothetical protein